jgi:hypothetical protein
MLHLLHYEHSWSLMAAPWESSSLLTASQVASAWPVAPECTIQHNLRHLQSLAHQRFG